MVFRDDAQEAVTCSKAAEPRHVRAGFGLAKFYDRRQQVLKTIRNPALAALSITNSSKTFRSQGKLEVGDQQGLTHAV
jgi:hypothetical protein